MANIYDTLLLTQKNEEGNYILKGATTTCIKTPFDVEVNFPAEVTKKTSSSWHEYWERGYVKISVLWNERIPIFENEYDWKVSYSCKVEEWIKFYLSEKWSLWTWDKALSIRVSQDDTMLWNTEKAEAAANAELEQSQDLPF